MTYVDAEKPEIRKGIIVLGKRYIPFGEKVYTFWRKGIYVLEKRYIRFGENIYGIYAHENFQ